jgi:uncharacterized protein YegL
MKDNYTHIHFVLDRSGSMESVWNDTIGGFNTFLKTQKEAVGEATFSLIQFDHEVITDYSFINIQEVKELDRESFVPRGMTAMNDAIGVAINDCGKALALLDESERPDKVIFVILTDGGENASKTFSRSKIKEMIEHQNLVYSWAFMFLGANIDASKVGATLGVDADFTSGFEASTRGVSNTFGTLGNKLGNMRSSAGPLYCMGVKSPIAKASSYTVAEREEMNQK